MRRPRWRCARPTCWAHRWQSCMAVGEYDPVDVAMGELERHWAKEHRDEQREAA